MNNSAEVFESLWILTSLVCWLFGNEQKIKKFEQPDPEDATSVVLLIEWVVKELWETEW